MALDVTQSGTHDGSSGDDAAVDLLSWLRRIADNNAPAALDGQVCVPVAWIGRTSTEDQQDPTLSLPRQLATSRRALPEEMAIVAHFYDVESGRKSAEQRGHGQAHEHLNIPIPRDGGLADALAEARRPDRRFVAVVCESIDRISRLTYVGTRIEHEFEQAGVALLAADEGIDPNSLTFLADGIVPVKRATPTLTRRVKQAIAEWYVLNLLELSWGGLKAHTDQGYNIGKPPYGYDAITLRHPVKAKAAEGKVKRRLVPDPVRGPVVTTIFQWRALERLSYQSIAERLNSDPGRYPPPEPISGARCRRVGQWTLNSVREVLGNPKHTGYMVWNRRKNARPDRGVRGRVNPPNQWVWSSRPTHEPLVTKELFEVASAIGHFRGGSRPGSGMNRHPATKRTYVLRSYLFCGICGRRMWGNEKRGVTYYHCKPQPAYHAHKPWYDDHPRVVTLREDIVHRCLADFLGRRIFGPNRRLFLAHADHAEQGSDRESRIVTLKRRLTELQRRQDNIIRELEHYLPTGDADLDTTWRSNLRNRFDANARERRTLSTELDAVIKEAERPRRSGDAADRIDAIPQQGIDLRLLPEHLQRDLFDAFHLEMRYIPAEQQLTLRVTVSKDTAAAVHQGQVVP